MTTYRNDRQGRDSVINAIERLKEQGYVRNDRKNQSVVMKKLVRKGKYCLEYKVIRFVFKPEDVAIERVEETEFQGISQAEQMLFGWSPIEIEASNAVTAGIFKQEDKDILLKAYSNN